MDKIVKITIMSGLFKGLSPGMYYFIGTIFIFLIIGTMLKVGEKISKKIPGCEGNVMSGGGLFPLLVAVTLFTYLFLVGNRVPVQVTNLTNGESVVTDSWVGAKELAKLIEEDFKAKEMLAEIKREDSSPDQQENDGADENEKNTINWRIKRAKEVYAKKKELLGDTTGKSKIEEIEETRKIAYSFLKDPLGRDASDYDVGKDLIDRFFDIEIAQALEKTERH